MFNFLLVLSGSLDLGPIISLVKPLQEGEQLFHTLSKDSSSLIKVILKP